MKQPGTKDSHEAKIARNPIKIYPVDEQRRNKPSWLKIGLPLSKNFQKVKKIIKDNNLF